jgi:hypothetical protein
MKKPTQSQNGLSLGEFMQQYGTEEQCEEAFFSALAERVRVSRMRPHRWAM